MLGFLRANNNHRYTDTEGDLILRDLQKAFKFRYYIGNSLSRNNKGASTFWLAKVLLRDDGYIMIAEDVDRWKVPEILQRKGLKGLYDYRREATYLYAIRDRRMTEIRNGKIKKDWDTPRLSTWKEMERYILSL